MTTIKSAQEIAMEKSKNINRLSPQEMAEMKQQEKVDAILSLYYKGRIGSDDLCHNLKGLPNKFLVDTQKKLLQSLTFLNNAHEVEKRKKGILAIENLKGTNQSSVIDEYFVQLQKAKDGFKKDKKQWIQNLEKELERDPQKKMQAFRQGNQIMIKEMSIEEILEQNQQFKQEIQNIDNQWKKQFDIMKEKLSDIVNSSNSQVH